MVSSSSLFLKIYVLSLAATIGLLCGSALNCLAFRIVHKEKWSSGRSRCPSCQHMLSALDLFPLFSYIFLKGKCRYCGSKISVRYPITEFILAIIFVSILLKYDISLETLQLLVVCSCLFCLSLVDLDVQIIPDRFHLIMICTRIFFLIASNGLTVSLLSKLWFSLWHGLLIGGSVLLLSLIMDKVLHKDSMGGGDIKLLFVLGLFFDIPCCFLLILLACFIGIALAFILGVKKQMAFPFGPAISISAWLTFLFGSSITSWYLGLF